MRKLVFTAIIACAAIASCKTSKDPVKTPAVAGAKPSLDCTSSKLTYDSDIKAIMETNCARCHNENLKAGYNFHTLESVKKAAVNGDLLRSIKHAKGIEPMPAYADKLDDKTISKIECWISNGMK